MIETYTASSVVNQVMEAVIRLMNATKPFARVTRGALPTGPGLCCEIGPSRTQNIYLDKNSYVPLIIVMNGKHSNLETLSDAMNGIHSALTRATTYPEDPAGTRWQITDIETTVFPRVVGREDNNDWLMASTLSVRFFWRGD